MATINGTPENDDLVGVVGESNIISGLGGNDILSGREMADTISGGSGNDNINGDAPASPGSADVLYGDDGNDYVATGEKGGLASGGTGSDTLYLGWQDAPAALTFNATTATAGSWVLAHSAFEVFSITGTAYGDTITTAAGNDGVSSGGGNDTVRLGAGDDDCSAGDGDDTIYGEAGNDGIGGGAGNDHIYGGEGNNSLGGDLGNDYITAGAGTDGLFGDFGTTYDLDPGGDDTLDPGDGGGVVSGGNGTDLLILKSWSTKTSPIELNTDSYYDARVGAITLAVDRVERFDVLGTPLNDRLYGMMGGGSDTLNGMDGNDTIGGETGDDLILGGNGNDWIIAFPGNDTVDAGTGNDDVGGWGGDDSLLGGTGNDTLNGGDGNDTIRGGDGTDTINGGYGMNVLDGGSGNDTITGGGYDRNTLIGGIGDDTLEATEQGGMANGGDGNDYLQVTSWWDAPAAVRLTGTSMTSGTWSLAIAGIERAKIQTQDYNDTLTAFGGNDTLWAGNGNNYVIGAAGNDAISAGTGNDSLYGATGNDTIEAWDGNDRLDGGVGADSMTGGTGDDTYIVESVADVIFEDYYEGTDTVRSTISYTLPDDFEYLALDGTAANGTGNARPNRLTGNAGNNILDGAGGIDTMAGGAGNDTYFTDYADVITESAGGGTDTVRSTENRTLGANLENLVLQGGNPLNGNGNSLANTLTGNIAANSLQGVGGNDKLQGLAGNDTLLGALPAAPFGAAEIDTLSGGSGNDLFKLGISAGRLYDDNNAAIAGLAGYALVTDFTAGDKLQLKGAVAQYRLGTSPVGLPAGQGLFHDSNANGVLNPTDELIAVIQGPNAGNALAGVIVV